MQGTERRSRRHVAGAARLGALLALATAVLVADSARAGWDPVHAPGAIRSLAVADADTWLALGSANQRPLWLTTDRGESWSTVEAEGLERADGVGAASGRSFRIAGRSEGDDTAIEVLRLDPGTAPSPFGAPIADPERRWGGALAVADDGSTWIPLQGGSGVSKVAIVDPDETTQVVPVPGAAGAAAWSVTRTAFGLRLVESSIVTPWSPPPTTHGTWRFDGEQWVAAEPRPVIFRDGDLMIAASGDASWDGGGHWSAASSTGLIPRSPGLGVPRYGRVYNPSFDGQLLTTRHSSSLLTATGLVFPGDAAANRTVDTGPVLVSPNKYGTDEIYVHSGPFPGLPKSIGKLDDDAQAMISRANVLRADAGLPPLLGDAKVSEASRNHSRYTALNGGEGAHSETEGKPGYTGSGLFDRCRHVGAECWGEVMSPVASKDPSGSWLTTIWHRTLPGSPSSGVVGAAQVDRGWAVMNWSGRLNALIRPIGYPSGIWRGRLDFRGESPDPVYDCRHTGQQVDWPLGAAVSLYVPTVDDLGDAPPSVRDVEVRERGSSAPLEGCFLTAEDLGDAANEIGIFLPDDPLVDGSTYDACGEWDAGGVILEHCWSFTARPDALGRNPDLDPRMDVVVRGARRMKLNRKRVVRLGVRCGASMRWPPCEGVVRLKTRRKFGVGRRARARVDLASGTFRLGAGEEAKLRLRLSKRASRLVRRKKSARKIWIWVEARDDVGNEAGMGEGGTLRVVRRKR